MTGNTILQTQTIRIHKFRARNIRKPKYKIVSQNYPNECMPSPILIHTQAIYLPLPVSRKVKTAYKRWQLATPTPNSN
jgi:hypothetical protein